MKTKQEIINEILESGVKYVKTTFSREACAVSIAISDIQNDDRTLEGFEWSECSTGLNEDDY